MSAVCVYCGEPKYDKIGCCGENHWEDQPDCPECGSGQVDKDETTSVWHCHLCQHDWTHIKE